MGISDKAKEIIDQAPNWNMVTDIMLFKWMEEIGQSVENHGTAINAAFAQQVSDVKMLGISLDNVTNNLALLGETKFVENRILDEDETIANPSEISQAEKKPVQTEEEVWEECIEVALKTFNEYHERVELEIEDSDEEENEKTYVYKLKNPHARPLPYIIGSKEFNESRHAGLCSSGSEISDGEESDKFSSSSSSSTSIKPEQKDDMSKTEKFRKCSPSASVSDNDVNIEQNIHIRSAADFEDEEEAVYTPQQQHKHKKSTKHSQRVSSVGKATDSSRPQPIPRSAATMGEPSGVDLFVDLKQQEPSPLKLPTNKQMSDLDKGCVDAESLQTSRTAKETVVTEPSKKEQTRSPTANLFNEDDDVNDDFVNMMKTVESQRVANLFDSNTQVAQQAKQRLSNLADESVAALRARMAAKQKTVNLFDSQEDLSIIQSDGFAGKPRNSDVKQSMQNLFSGDVAKEGIFSKTEHKHSTEDLFPRTTPKKPAEDLFSKTEAKNEDLVSKTKYKKPTEDLSSKAAPNHAVEDLFSKNTRKRSAEDLFSQTAAQKATEDIFSKTAPKKSAEDLFSRTVAQKPTEDLFSKTPPKKSSENIFSSKIPTRNLFDDDDADVDDFEQMLAASRAAKQAKAPSMGEKLFKSDEEITTGGASAAEINKLAHVQSEIKGLLDDLSKISYGEGNPISPQKAGATNYSLFDDIDDDEGPEFAKKYVDFSVAVDLESRKLEDLQKSIKSINVDLIFKDIDEDKFEKFLEREQEEKEKEKSGKDAFKKVGENLKKQRNVKETKENEKTASEPIPRTIVTKHEESAKESDNQFEKQMEISKKPSSAQTTVILGEAKNEIKISNAGNNATETKQKTESTRKLDLWAKDIGASKITTSESTKKSATPTSQKLAHETFAGLFFDEPPEDDNEPVPQQTSKTNTSDLLQSFYEPALPELPKEKTTTPSEKASGTRQLNNTYQSYGLFSDVPPEDDNQSSAADTSKVLHTVFYDDFQETKAALKHQEAQQKQENQHSHSMSKNLYDIFSEEPPLDAELERKYGEYASGTETKEGEKNIDPQSSADSHIKSTIKDIVVPKLPKLNINVQALLPGAMPKLSLAKPVTVVAQSSEETRSETKQNQIQEMHSPEVSRPVDAKSKAGENLLIGVCKDRVRAPSKRRPSTRKGRQEIYQKTLLEQQEELENETQKKEIQISAQEIAAANKELVSNISVEEKQEDDGEILTDSTKSKSKKSGYLTLFDDEPPLFEAVIPPTREKTANKKTKSFFDESDERAEDLLFGVPSTSSSMAQFENPATFIEPKTEHLTPSILTTPKLPVEWDGDAITASGWHIPKNTEQSTAKTATPKIESATTLPKVSMFFDDDEDDDNNDYFLESKTDIASIIKEPLLKTAKTFESDEGRTTETETETETVSAKDNARSITMKQSYSAVSQAKMMYVLKDVDDDDDDDDDLFATATKSRSVALPKSTVSMEQEKAASSVDKLIGAASIESPKKSYFAAELNLSDSEDGDEDDFLFGATSKILKKSLLKTLQVQNSDEDLFAASSTGVAAKDDIAATGQTTGSIASIKTPSKPTTTTLFESDDDNEGNEANIFASIQKPVTKALQLQEPKGLAKSKQKSLFSDIEDDDDDDIFGGGKTVPLKQKSSTASVLLQSGVKSQTTSKVTTTKKLEATPTQMSDNPLGDLFSD